MMACRFREKSEINYSLTDTIKFKRLKMLLKREQWEVVGLLESLWMFAAKYSPAGDIGRFDDDGIAAGIGYSGDISALLEKMIESGWIKSDGECRLSINEWEKHAQKWLIGSLARRGIKIGEATPEKTEKRIPISAGVRFDALSRDRFICQYCGARGTGVLLEVDHVTPVSKGGTNDLSNLRTACYKCNAGKSDKLLEECQQ